MLDSADSGVYDLWFLGDVQFVGSVGGGVCKWNYTYERWLSAERANCRCHLDRKPPHDPKHQLNR